MFIPCQARAFFDMYALRRQMREDFLTSQEFSIVGHPLNNYALCAAIMNNTTEKISAIWAITQEEEQVKNE